MNSTMIEMPLAVLGTGLPNTSDDKWRREFHAFQKLLPELLKTHRGEYVAVQEGRVVGTGPDKLQLAMVVHREFGKVPILVRLVTAEPQRVVSMPSLHRMNSISMA